MECLVGKAQLRCKSLLVGERLDLRSLSKLPRAALQTIATNPLTVAIESGAVVILFRYGAVVLFDVPAADEAALLDRLRPFISSPLSKTEVDEIEVRVDPNATEGVENGVIVLKNHDVERFQVVAENASKSIVLGLYEARVAESFDRIEPFGLEIEITGRSRQKARALLRHLGTALLSQQQMVGRVHPSEKPDVLWDRPDLEVLNLRVADELEIRERNVVLERKLDLIARTSQILLDLLQDRRTLRVEWYVVGLIVFEIFLSLFQMTIWRR
ncbi:MAG TPA: RMD1 family protein [Planctomycetaceae bacterium]|nr:RMD1 family protein [Planctomycetaceae bacterium]